MMVCLPAPLTAALSTHSAIESPVAPAAGSVYLMHAWLHGSAPNLTDQPRTLYITTYYAEDAIELSPNHLPSRFTHELVRGVVTGTVRCSSYSMPLPAVPDGTSFFAQQEAADK